MSRSRHHGCTCSYTPARNKRAEAVRVADEREPVGCDDADHSCVCAQRDCPCCYGGDAVETTLGEPHEVAPGVTLQLAELPPEREEWHEW